MRKIPTCHICGKTKYRLMGYRQYVCEYAIVHDSRPKWVGKHLVERSMLVAGLMFKYGDYRK